MSKPAKLTEQDIMDYDLLPPKEKLKAWDSLKRLEALGKIKIDDRLKKPDEEQQGKNAIRGSG